MFVFYLISQKIEILFPHYWLCINCKLFVHSNCGKWLNRSLCNGESDFFSQFHNHASESRSYDTNCPMSGTLQSFLLINNLAVMFLLSCTNITSSHIVRKDSWRKIIWLWLEICSVYTCTHARALERTGE